MECLRSETNWIGAEEVHPIEAEGGDPQAAWLLVA